nr:pentatricopeptide repeat-containing protein At4g18975, chloroplastic-like isoform X1 [Ipomoea batatas]
MGNAENYFREEQRKNEHHLWKKRDSAGSGQKALNLLGFAATPRMSELVYSAHYAISCKSPKLLVTYVVGVVCANNASHSWSVGFALIDLLGRVGRRGALVNWKRRRKLQHKFQAALLPTIGRLDGLQVRSYCDDERRIGNVLLVRDGRE